MSCLLRLVIAFVGTAPTPASPLAPSPPSQGDGLLRTASSDDHRTRGLTNVRAPKRDALPRSLQPTRCHEYPPVFRLPSVVLAHFRSRLHSTALSHARLRVPDTARSASTPGLRCRRARPQVMLRLGAAVTSCDPVHPLSSRPASCSLASDPRARVRRAHEPDVRAADVLCRAAASDPPERNQTPRHRGPTPLAVRQHRAVDEPRTPSLDGSPKPSPSLTAGSFFGAATASPASPPERSFQHAFTRTLCALGPAASGYSPVAREAT